MPLTTVIDLDRKDCSGKGNKCFNVPKVFRCIKKRESKKHSLQSDTDNIEIHKYMIERTEFPNFHYVLTESENALIEMKQLVKELENSLNKQISDNPLMYGCAEEDTDLSILLGEMRNKTFGGEQVILEIIGEETVPSVIENMTYELPTSESSDNLELYTVGLCYPDKAWEEKVLKYLQSLSSKDLQRVVFITENQRGMEKILQETFPKSFAKSSGKGPLFAKEETLKSVISDVLLDRAFDVLDNLLYALKLLMTKTNEAFKDKKCKQYKEKTEQIKNAIEDIESLVQERPGSNPPKLKCISEELYDNLMRLKPKGVKGCCMYDETLLVFVDTEEDSRAELEREIRSVTQEHVNNNVIVHAKCPLYKFQISDGDKIIPEREMNKDKKFGTIGTFVADDRNRKLGLTAGHVVYKDENIFTGDELLFGTCTEVSDQTQNAANLAVIEIHHQAVSKCNDRSKELCLFGGTKNEIASKQRVYKIGANTKETRGIIKTDFACFEHFGDFLVVEGMHGRPFSQGGDSGSVVYMRDLKTNKEVAISMVTAGGYKAAASDAVTTHDLHNLPQDDHIPIATLSDDVAATSVVEVQNDSDIVGGEEIQRVIDNWSFTFMLKKEIDKIERRGLKLIFN